MKLKKKPSTSYISVHYSLEVATLVEPAKQNTTTKSAGLAFPR